MSAAPAALLAARSPLQYECQPSFKVGQVHSQTPTCDVLVICSCSSVCLRCCVCCACALGGPLASVARSARLVQHEQKGEAHDLQRRQAAVRGGLRQCSCNHDWIGSGRSPACRAALGLSSAKRRARPMTCTHAGVAAVGMGPKNCFSDRKDSYEVAPAASHRRLGGLHAAAAAAAGQLPWTVWATRSLAQ